MRLLTAYWTSHRYYHLYHLYQSYPQATESLQKPFLLFAISWMTYCHAVIVQCIVDVLAIVLAVEKWYL